MRKKGHPDRGPNKAEATRLKLGKSEGQIGKSRIEGPEVCSLSPMVQRQIKVREPPRGEDGVSDRVRGHLLYPIKGAPGC